MRDLKSVQPLADFDWNAAEEEHAKYAADEKEKMSEAYDKTFNQIGDQQVVEGVVVAKDNREVIVNIGFKSDGIIPLNEFRYNPDLKVGDKVEVFVVQKEDAGGQLRLSHKDARILKSWERVNQAYESHEIINGYVKSRTKGGLIVDVFGIEAFLPGSQIDVKPIRDYDVFVDKVMEFKVVKINNEYKNVVVSHKALIEDEIEAQKAEIIAKLEKGQVIENVPVTRLSSHKASVNIMYGCDKFCTYCIVPYTRGKQRSRKMSEILKEVQQLKDEGYKEITLLGQNVNAYGKDMDNEQDFATLLEEVAKIGIPRVRFTTSHPWDFSEEMIDIIAKYDNIMPFIHLPLQSGDDDVLKLMGRRYTKESYLALYDKIVNTIPNVSVSTDIIVGFPNETDEQFEHTLDVVRYCKYDNAFTFIFSARPGTPASRMHDSIDMETKRKRLATLNKTWNDFALEKNKAYVGRTVTVLVDGPSKKNENVYSGYTDTQKLVNFKGEIIPCFI